MERNKIMILEYSNKSYTYQTAIKEGFLCFEAIKNQDSSCFFLRLIRRLHLSSFLPFKSIWFGPWKGMVRDVDVIILFAFSFNVCVLKWLIRNAKGKRIIYYYLNPIRRANEVELIKCYPCEQWSFDRNDCLKFGIRFNDTYYGVSKIIPQMTTDFDVFFVGQDKGRYEFLKQIENQMNTIGLKVYFHIVSDAKLVTSNRNFKNPISYDEVLNYVSRSVAILDVLQKGQSGLTQRPMEAIFFKKKLITTDKEIRRYDFY